MPFVPISQTTDLCTWIKVVAGVEVFCQSASEVWAMDYTRGELSSGRKFLHARSRAKDMPLSRSRPFGSNRCKNDTECAARKLFGEGAP
jgi:hypothetical protein